MYTYEYLLSANLLPILAMAILLIFVCKNPLFGRRQTILFTIAISVVMVAIIAVSFDTLISFGDKTGKFYWLRRITSFLNFSLSPFAPFLLLKIFNNKKTPIFLILPLIINTILCFISIFINLVFYISFNNKYTRGILFFAPFIITIFYVLLLIFGGRKMRTRGKHIEQGFLVIAIAILVGAMIMEIYFYSRNYVWGATSLVFVMYYLLLNIQARVTDTLTGLYNRAMYYSILETINKKKKCGIAVLDINNFKNVNDTFGHEAGDKVLITFSKLLEEAMSLNAVAYRIGGDEFVCIEKKGNIESLNNSLEKLKEKCLKHEIYFAWGAVLYTPEKDIFQAVDKADSLMYLNKEYCKLSKKDKIL